MSGPRLDPFVVATELVAHALRACPGEVALVACYGSRAAGTGSPESDLDLYYVPVEGANPGLCRQFVLDGLPYDFWPVSWDFLEGIANATSSRPWSVAAGLVGQARLLYARSEADRERFETLQARLKALTGPENRAAMRRRAAAAFGDVAAALGWLELAEGPDELARAGAELLNAACNCLGLLNQTAFTRGWGSNWPEVLALPIIPPGLEASAAVLLAGADAQAARVTGAGLAREVRDLIREPEASLPGEAPEAVFGGAYPFVVEYLSKVRSAAAAGDPNRARLAAVTLQGELGAMLARVGGRAGSPLPVVQAEAFARAGFVNLLSAGGLDGMAAATTVLDRQVRAWLAGRGVPLNVLDDLGQLRGFLEAPGTG